MPGHQSKSLLEMPFGDLQKKWVHRHPVEELREFLIHHGQLSSGKKPELVDRVVDFAEEKAKDVIEEALADDDDAAAPLPKEIKEDDVVKRIASISEAERDLLVGRHLRSLGGEFATQYGELLRAAIRSDPPEMRGRLLDSTDKDRYVPTRSHTWTWRHFHLRHSDGGARSFCNHCAWDVPTHNVPDDHPGVKKFAHGHIIQNMCLLICFKSYRNIIQPRSDDEHEHPPLESSQHRSRSGQTASIRRDPIVGGSLSATMVRIWAAACGEIVGHVGGQGQIATKHRCRGGFQICNARATGWPHSNSPPTHHYKAHGSNET